MDAGNNKHYLLLKNLSDAFAYHQIVTDSKGKPVDYIFLDVNPVFESMTGLSRDKIIGKKVTVVLPGIENSDFDWIGTYGKVAYSGESISFEQYFEIADRWYSVTAYSDEPGYFAALFRDITSSEKEKKDLEKLVRSAQLNLQQPIGELNYQHLTDELLQLSGAKFVAINTYEEKGTKSVTRAISGIPESICKAAGVMGFELTGKAWDIIPERAKSIKDGHLLHFENLSKSASGAISKQASFLLEKLFGLGEVYVIATAYQDQFLGDFIIFMSLGQQIYNLKIVELYANQAGIMLLRKQAEQALQEKERRLSQAQTFTGTGFWEYEIKTENLYWSKECEALFGLDEGEFEGSFYDFLKRVHPDDREYVKSMNRPITKKYTGVPLEYEHRIVKKDGTVCFVRESAGVVTDKAGNAVRITGFVMNITRHKLAEEALKASEARLELFFSQSLAGYFFMMLDEPVVWNDSIDKEKTLDYVFSHQRMTKVNQALLDQYRATKEDFLGSTHFDLFQHDIEHRRYIWRNLFDKGQWHVETNERRLDGTQMWVDGDYICIYDAQGRITGHFGVQADVTERKQEEERKKFQIEFQQIAAETSAAMTGLVTGADFDRAVNVTLQRLGKFLGADRSYLFQFSEKLDRMTNTHEWCAEGVEAQIQSIQGQKTDDLPWWKQRILEHKPVIISDVAELPPEAGAEKKEFLLQNIRALICLPTIAVHGQLSGFMGFDIMKGPCQWPDEHVTMLQLVADTIGGTLERIRVQEVLQKSEEYTRSVVEVIPDIIIRFTKNGDYLDVISSSRDKLYLPAQETIGKNIKDILPESIAHRAVEHITKTLKTGSLQVFEYEMEISDRKMCFEARLVSFGRDEVIALIRDITERKQAEEMLNSQNILLNTQQELSPDGILVVNADDEMVSFNQRFADIWEIPDDIMALQSGEKALNYVLPKLVDPEEFAKRNNYLLKNKQEVSHEEIALKDGRIFEHYSAPMIGNNNRYYGRVWYYRDITERKQAENKIRYISFHDNLTGLYNRHYLEEEMKRLDTVRQLPISTIMIDVNGLKLVNDTYGHEAGDEMLKTAARIIRESCREEDIIARWGGDEFVIFLSKTALNVADAICTRINEKCRKTYVRDVPVSMALGVSVKDDEEKDLTKALQEAEDKMYKQKLAESRSTRSNVLNTMLRVLETKSFETVAHAGRMQLVALKIGEKISLSDPEMNRLSLLITLHDIGKTDISEEILKREGPLTAEEWLIMKKHPETGYRIARATEEFAHVAEDILAHHERWDGLGYPEGLKGKEIPLLARVAAIADAYEVMANGRPYKKPMSKEEIKEVFKRCAGTQFDPELVDIFLPVLEG